MNHRVGPTRLIAASALFFTLLLPALGQEIPRIEHPVNDLAGVLSPEAEASIEAVVAAHREKTGVQVAVLTVPSTGGIPVEDFSLKAAETWAGGSRGRDNGVLFTLAVRDRTMRIEVGYGLEAALPDARALRIQEGAKPLLREGDYDGAVQLVVKGVIIATTPAAPEPPQPPAPLPLGARVPWTYLAVFGLGSFGAFLMLLLDARDKRSGAWGLVPLLFMILLPVLVGLVFLGGKWFWWAYPLVYFVGMFFPFLLQAITKDSRFVAWCVGIWAYVLGPAPLVLSPHFHTLSGPRGSEVLYLLLAHFFVCGFGSVFFPFPYLVFVLSRRRASGQTTVLESAKTPEPQPAATANAAAAPASPAAESKLWRLRPTFTWSAGSSGGSSHTSGGSQGFSWSSHGSSSSRASSSREWSGGGGRFGGGGASSSW